MMKTSATRKVTAKVLCWIAAGVLCAAGVGADWLVTRAGERIETEGGWQVKLDPPVNRVLPVSRRRVSALWERFGE